MDIASFLSPNAVIAASTAASKRQVLQEVAVQAAELTDLTEREVLHALLARERLGSTAVGNGIAIPHARFAGLENLRAIFVRLQRPVDFEAPDDKPVELLFAMLAPADANAEHLRAMARVSRLLRDKHCCEKIRQAVTAEVIYNLLTAQDEESAS
jgi:nitrogen PTS system EIIA component